MGFQLLDPLGVWVVEAAAGRRLELVVVLASILWRPLGNKTLTRCR